jgi:beta-glucosidase
MKITFPPDFIFGTSTSAYQIETPVDHDWLGVKSRDGNVFDRTTDHERKVDEDVDIISSLAPHYRMSLMWSKLQPKAFAEFDQEAVRHYKNLLDKLVKRNVKIMMVVHHFANPQWFAQNGGWLDERNIAAFVDFARKLNSTFGKYIWIWNTFNEPNLYCSMAYVEGEFPPFRKNILSANRAIRNMAIAHNVLYEMLKVSSPDKLVGISHNCTLFEGDNLLGKIPAKFFDWCYMDYASDLFRKTDFFGMSYYARIGFDPLPVTYITTPDKFVKSGKRHDDMWEYYPEGLEKCILRFSKKYDKPVIITENGICTNDDEKRIGAIQDYMLAISNAMRHGAKILGYYHWSTWDNFEWSLGPTFKFGLYACDQDTKERTKKPSADVYSVLAHSKEIIIDKNLVDRY